jgi:hypothetical protein
MPASLHLSNRRAASRVLCAVALAIGLAAASGASAQALFMRVDGVKGDNLSGQPLGADAFPILNFTISTDPREGSASAKFAESGERFSELDFTLTVSGPAIAIWQLAAERKEVPKVSLVSVDPSTGKVDYRVDLEKVVVYSMSFQTAGKRDAAVGELHYQRIRIRSGENGPTAKNAPWK